MTRNTLVKSIFIITLLITAIMLAGCQDREESNVGEQTKIVFLHHSTGQVIWDAGLSRVTKKLGFDSDVEKWFKKYNSQNGTHYLLTEMTYPKREPYGWKNYPYDYYNIWVKNAGDQPYMEEATLEILTSDYDVIVFKHCFPVSAVKADSNRPDIDSDVRTLGNYQLQYEALKKKLHEFPQTKFVLWTPTALVEQATNAEDAQRASEFAEWVKTVWDTPGDNIFLWDFRSLQTEGGLYLKDIYAAGATNSHPNSVFAKTVAPYFCNRVVTVIEGEGDKASLTGK